MVSNNRKIGIGLTMFGVLFLVLGVLLLFDTALLALGNVMFLAGLTLIIGAKNTIIFFSRKGKLLGTVCFLGGIVLVMMKWAIFGMLLELFGIVSLFGNFVPVIIVFLRSLPVTGHILNHPLISKWVERMSPSLPYHSR